MGNKTLSEQLEFDFMHNMRKGDDRERDWSNAKILAGLYCVTMTPVPFLYYNDHPEIIETVRSYIFNLF